MTLFGIAGVWRWDVKSYCESNVEFPGPVRRGVGGFDRSLLLGIKIGWVGEEMLFVKKDAQNASFWDMKNQGKTITIHSGIILVRTQNNLSCDKFFDLLKFLSSCCFYYLP